MNKNHFVSVGGLVTKDNDVLLVKSPLRGWEFPGGMVEPGESLHQALKREVYEESGVTIEVISLVGACKNIQSDIVNLDFLCTYVGGELTTSAESSEVGWFAKEKAVELVKNELAKKRLANMLSMDGEPYCFSFIKEPFEVMGQID